MSQSPDNSTLEDRHYVTLILRLTLNRAGQLIQGELADTTDSRQEHFIGTVGLHQAVDAWLRQQHARANRTDSPPRIIKEAPIE
jgi:hypothetical protein